MEWPARLPLEGGGGVSDTFIIRVGFVWVDKC